MTEKLKVVMACDTFAPDINGAARFTERLAAGLAARGHEVHIIAASYDSSAGSRAEKYDGSELTVHRLRSHRVPTHASLRWTEPWGLTSKVERVLQEVKPDALHIQSHLLVGRFAAKAALRRGVRTIATNHIMPENLLKYLLVPGFLRAAVMRFIWRDAATVLRKVDAVTTPTRRAAGLLEGATGLTGVLAISCGIDASKFATSNPPSNQDPSLLFLGRLDDEKRIPVLLRAVAELTEFPTLRVELAGDGGERENLKRLAKELGIQDRVKLLGHVSDAELSSIYQRCTAFVMPSIAELQSIATMEAMAAGRPVVAANAMALPHLVHHGDNGYLFEPDNHVDLANQLRKILSANPEELARLSENSQHLIQAHDINKTLDIFEDLYRGLGEPSPTTLDNAPGYLDPIGKLSVGISESIRRFRQEASVLRDRAEDLTEELREKIAEVSSEAKEQLEEIKQEVKKTARKIRKRLGE